MRYSSPRHLSDPRRGRAALIGVLLLISVTVVIGGLLARALSVQGSPAGADVAAPPEATVPPPTEPPPTVSAPAAKPAQTEPPTSSPPSSSSAADAVNLLGNPGFEDGLGGWRAIGDARLELAGQAHDGQQAARLTAASGTQLGMIARQVARCQAHRSYMATAWVRGGRPGATIEINLIEYVSGRRLVTDVAGHVLPDAGWQRIEVDHVASRGSHFARYRVSGGGFRASSDTWPR
jgi:hypothetical protein